LSLVLLAGGVYSESISVQAYELRLETIGAIRMLEPAIRNFGVPPKDTKATTDKYWSTLESQYNIAQQAYTLGLSYYYEKNFLSAMTEFKRCQVELEKILERLSQSYIDRAREILVEATGAMHPNMDKKGVSVMEISVKLGPDSQRRKYFRVNRRAPVESRFYDPKDVHLARTMQAIELNLNNGYSSIADASEARNRAITIEHSLEPHQPLRVLHRSKRIYWYTAAIEHARQAKRNGLNIFILKYPYENIPHQQNLKADGKTAFNYDENAAYLPKKIHPVFDERVPEKYRRDSSDALGYIFEDEVAHKLENAQWKDGEWLKCDAKGQNCKALN